MAVLTDFHMHSSFSGDSDAPMEEMIRAGIDLGLTHMCFTEHNDYDFPVTELDPEGKFVLNPDAYLYGLLSCREKYADRMKVLFGIELGLQPHLAEKNRALAQAYDYDFIIGSSHICNLRDPYYPEFYEGRREEEAYREYFSSILDNLNCFSDFDVYGHLDYVVRYGPNKDNEYTYEKYRDVLDPILEKLLQMGKGIEINTGGTKKALKDLHPCRGILKKYRQLGGEIITIGSDAHKPCDIAQAFSLAEESLKDCGFRYYTIFEKRKPQFIKL